MLILDKGIALISLAGFFEHNNAICLSLAESYAHGLKLTLVVQFYCDKCNPWLELQSAAIRY